MADSERITHATSRDVELAHGGVLALVTLDNGLDAAAPATLGPLGLSELHGALATLAERAARGEIQAVGVTGAPPLFLAGADLRTVGAIRDRDAGWAVARAGHDAFRLLGEMPVPTFAFVNGPALGGGLELALSCTYRTVAADVTQLGLPEVRLGLVPGWGGCYLVPHLVGLTAAIDLVVRRPLVGRLTTAAEARRLGLVDELCDPASFLVDSLRWADDVLTGAVTVERSVPEAAADVVDAARADLDRRLHGAAPAPYRALDLLAAAPTADRDAAFAAEDDALADLLMSEEFRSGRYAFELTTRRTRPAPDAAAPRPIGQVGIVGAGLMATQLAVLVASRLQVPVVMREVDDDRAAAGRAAITRQVTDLVAAGRLSESDGARLRAAITVGTDLSALAGADLVIEAVTEIMAVKQRVFADVEAIVDPTAVLATNTSALSVTTMGAALRSPERVVGLHFFNPVARMPLVEVVHTAATDPVSRATGFDVARRLGKTAVPVADRPGFVVNRVLLRLLADVAATVERGTPVEVADRALRPMGLPMGPFALIDLVGLPVALHVLGTLHDQLGDRFPLSPGLTRLAQEGRRLTDDAGDVDPAIQAAFGDPRAGALDEGGVLAAVLDGLAEEVGLMLDEGVVDGPAQVDLCMILGAGWPFHLGGITPYLDRSGHAEAVRGRRFLEPGVASVPAE